jgi:hypothetical protein
MSSIDSRHQTAHIAAVLPGTGRLGVVRAYFDIYAILGGLVTAGMLVATLWPKLGASATVAGGHPWLSIVSGAVFTWGSFQTSRLLRERDRFSVWAAGFTFAASLVATGSRALSLPTVGLSVLGLGLLASVWRYLE